MAKKQFIRNFKDTILNWSILIFILLLGVGAIISSLFQTPEQEKSRLATYRHLFLKQNFNDLQEITIHNNQGDFSLQRNNKIWFLTHPRHLRAKQQVIQRLIHSLQNIEIQNFFPKDPINLTNFALNTPRYTLNLKFKNSTYRLAVGLKNPINNSNYLLLQKKSIIYQTSSIQFPIENIHFTNFIDTKVFPFMPNEINTLSVTRYQRKFIELQHLQNTWKPLHQDKISKYRQERINKFITHLLNFHSHIILDKLTEKQQKRIERYFKNPPIEITLVLKTGKKVNYYATTLLKKFPDINLNNELFFLMHQEGSPNYLLLNKQYFKFTL